MAFSYLQTDDRDDYFKQFNSKPKNHPILSMTLIDPAGNIILKKVQRWQIKSYAKKNFLPIGKSSKGIWRKLLEQKGFKVVNNY
jgi:hypothetical protein